MAFARYWWSRLMGRGGHLNDCRPVVIDLVGRAGGSTRAWVCDARCPVRARSGREGLDCIERWTGHRGR